MKLDRLVAKHEALGRNRARSLIIAGRIKVDGSPVRRLDHEVDRFTKVELDSTVILEPVRKLHIMLHKPAGVVSATTDPEHPTVTSLIDIPGRDTLHLVGRLDRWTTGLVLLTNDGRWSKALMDPAKKVPKVYLVETRDPIQEEAVAAFARGFHFHTEGLITLPAELEILGGRSARLTLHEGRYHQIKRMFHRTGNRVIALHRVKIGHLSLSPALLPGQWRHLTPEETARIAS